MTRPMTFLALAVLFAFAAELPAQSIYATLTGVVSDPSQGLVGQATVRLRDERVRLSARNRYQQGRLLYFASVPVGTYELTVEVAGFANYKETGHRAWRRRKTQCQRDAEGRQRPPRLSWSPGPADPLIPVDSGEKSSTLNAKQLENFVQVGSNAAEFIKIMPGFGIKNGTSNAANYSGQTIGINANGNAGSQSPLNDAFSYNGLPGNTLDITADGAHVSDPGCNCDTPVNPNADMIAEFKVTMSNFSAENQKGPAVISSVAKSGGQSFHGSGFLYARNYVLNANDWLSNSTGSRGRKTSITIPGGTIGGPVLIPGTNSTRTGKKFFFFTGYEYFYQVLDTGLLRATVPTAGMLNGQFLASRTREIGKHHRFRFAPGPDQRRNLTLYPGGIIPATAIDQNMQALMKLYPAAQYRSQRQRRLQLDRRFDLHAEQHQWMSRVDYNISDSTKLFVRYNLQRETQPFPMQLWSH